MAAKTNKIHVARSGAILGAYDRDKIGDLLDTGHLRPTDDYFDDASGQWTRLSELEAPTRPPSAEFKPSDLPEEAPVKSERSSSRSSRRSGGGKGKGKTPKGAQAAIGGWIASLVAIAVAACIWAYAQSLSGRLDATVDHVRDLEQTIDNLRRENQLLSEITPAGKIRAVITYNPAPNQVAVMSGATVGLYKREDIEASLARTSLGSVSSSSDFEDAVNRLKSSIPSPLQVTLTDSNGRVELPVAPPGDYVLVASAAKATAGGTERYFWLAGFHSSDQPSNLLLLNDKNAISLQHPDFKITTINTMASGQ